MLSEGRLDGGIMEDVWMMVDGWGVAWRDGASGVALPY